MDLIKNIQSIATITVALKTKCHIKNSVSWAKSIVPNSKFGYINRLIKTGIGGAPRYSK